MTNHQAHRGEDPFTPQLIREIRRRFVQVGADRFGRWIYFENAGGTPGMTRPNPADLPPGALAIVKNAAVVKPGEHVVAIRIERGRAVTVTGGQEAAALRRVWDAAHNPAVRVAAELGIGLNRAARLCGRRLEDEGVYGTVHIRFGSNITIGGRNAAPLHLDAVCGCATVEPDRQPILTDGQLAPELETATDTSFKRSG